MTITSKGISKGKRLAASALTLQAAAALIFFLSANDSSSGGESLRAVRRSLSGSRGRIVPKRDSGAQVWIINQPKCGTGSLTQSAKSAMGSCRPVPENEGAPPDTFALHCQGESWVYRTHNVEAAKDFKMKEEVKPDKCVVISAIRDPTTSIPSVFFEENKDRFCNGTQSKEEILEEYSNWLHVSNRPKTQLDRVGKVLREFGVTNILGAMKSLEEDGYTFLSPANPDGAWAGCELLFMQIDYEESNNNLSNGMAHAIEGAAFKQDVRREDLCPMAAGNYQALKNYELTKEVIEILSDGHPEIAHAITYYRKLKANQAMKLKAGKTTMYSSE